jgi:hypothetical protein
MRAWIFLLIGIFLLTATQGCSRIEIVVTPVPSSIVRIFTPIPTLTHVTVPSTQNAHVIPTFTPVRGPYIPYYVTTSADNVNLRTEPGTLFPVSRLLANGTRLQVQGHAPGGQWLYVLTDSNIYGWVLVFLVNGGYEGGPSPVIQPKNIQVVKGQVLDLSGVPVSGIGFALTQGTGPNAPRSDASTDSSGVFYNYLPQTFSGPWNLSYVSVACTSNTKDAKCICIGGVCGRADPDSQVITLPYSGTLQFTWK